jgi:hypothetical protein
MKSRFVYLVAFTALTLASLCAGPVPITPSQLGYNPSVTFGPSGQPEYLICPADVSGGCGGAFTENIGGINATIWCVDSQLDVHFGDTYPAYIEDLNGTPAPFDTNHVHYMNVTTYTGGAGGWSYCLAGLGLATPDSALTRYELAAILISQYIPNSAMPDGGTSCNTATCTENKSIQDAIWHLTENNVAPNLGGAINIGAPAGYTDWIAYAAHLLSTEPASFFNQWAVVSGGWNVTTGTFSGTQYQTFLVQVTPEPRFYGLLLVGLLGLCGVVYRRRLAA